VNRGRGWNANAAAERAAAAHRDDYHPEAAEGVVRTHWHTTTTYEEMRSPSMPRVRFMEKDESRFADLDARIAARTRQLRETSS
jgi:hypothetical protein